MRLMLLIVGLVLGCFLIWNAIKRRGLKYGASLHEEFEKKILENVDQDQQITYQNSMPINLQKDNEKEPDPLFDELKQPSKVLNLDATKAFEHEDDVEVADEVVAKVESECEVEIAHNKPLEPKQQGFIVLTILPKESTHFSGNAITTTLIKNQFKYGKQKLYHRHVEDNPELPIMYSVGSLKEPGYFEHEKSKQLFPGIFIYMMYSHLQEAQETFEKMLTCARQISAVLNAQLCDSKRIPLTTQEIKKIREKINTTFTSSELEQKEYEVW
ncbi:MAG: hypothetical protein JSS07_05195 [Proteobacteria bacterium]|nr:hypothetical protein [Pseudomonadota bacterium]